jgi:membrane fusion protein (multidrug efflux system)
MGNADIAASNLERAQRDADRYAKLNEQNAIAKQTYEDALTNLQNAKTQLQSAKAALSNAQTDFNYSLIKAPFNGTIGFSLVKPGTFVNAGQTLLNTISSDDPVGVDFVVNEESLPGFLNLRTQVKNDSDSTFRLILPDNSEYPYSGKINVIDRAVDPRMGTIKIRLVFPNNERILRAGMNCRIKVLRPGSGDQVTIPFKAVVEQMGEYFVFVIGDSSKVRQERIEPGDNLGEYIVVKKGVKPGDRIVLDGLQRVRQGSVVKPDSSSEKQKR